MSTAELKYGLHQIIDSINDSKTLKTIYTVLSDKASSSTTLTWAEKKAVNAALKSISRGNTFTHQQVMSEMKSKYPGLVK